MGKITAAITGVGQYLPEYILTNDELSRMVDTNDEWIMSHTGIKTRHILKGEGIGSSYMGARAVINLLDKTGVDPMEIDVVICATVTPDMFFPSTGNLIADQAGCKNAFAFDVSAACSGFLFAIHTMECLLAQAPRKYGLVIGAEMLSRFINWEDRGTCVLFGDGAGAVVVEWREDYPSIHAVLGCHGDPDMLGVTGAEKPAPARIFMHGQPTFKFAVKAVPYCIDQVLEKAVMAIEDVDFFVFHQANARIIDLAAKKYHIPPEKYYKNIQKYGNTSAASIPLVISELHDLGKVGPGSRVLVVGFGGGLTWGGALVEFA
mgnify:CR=1 FL=1